MQRFAAERLDEATDLGPKYAAQLPATVRLATFVYNGYLNVDGKKYEAIIVQAFTATGTTVLW